jgi:subtilase family serine protease
MGSSFAAAISSFHGLYTRSGQFLMINSIRLLIVEAIPAAGILIAVVLAVVILARRRRRTRAFAKT